MNNNVICISDPFETINGVNNVGKVYVYKFNDQNNTASLLEILTPTSIYENMSFGENIEFDSNENILISATEEEITTKIYYNEVPGTNNIIPTKTISTNTKSMDLTTTGVVYQYNKDLQLVTKLKSHKALNQINYDSNNANNFGDIDIVRSGTYIMTCSTLTANGVQIKEHRFSELPSPNQLALYDNWFNLIYSYDYSFRNIAYCREMTATLFNGNTYDIIFDNITITDVNVINQIIESTDPNVKILTCKQTAGGLQYYNNQGQTVRINKFISTTGEIILDSYIRFRTYRGFTIEDFNSNNNHDYDLFTLSTKNTYSFKKYHGFFGGSLSYADAKYCGILAIGAPYYSKSNQSPYYNNKSGFVEIYTLIKGTNKYESLYVIELDKTKYPDIINFGKEVEATPDVILISADRKTNDNKIIGCVFMYKISFDASANISIDTNNVVEITESGCTDFGTAIDSYDSNIVISSPNTGKIFRYSLNEKSENEKSTMTLTYLQSIESEYIKNSQFGKKISINKNCCLVGLNSYTLNRESHNENATLNSIPGNGAILCYRDIGGKYTML
jgi:hypothetical protein